MKKTRRDISKMVEAEGLTLCDLSVTGNCHYCALVRNQRGIERKFFLSFTASDRRADLNRRSLFRRFANEVA